MRRTVTILIPWIPRSLLRGGSLVPDPVLLICGPKITYFHCPEVYLPQQSDFLLFVVLCKACGEWFLKGRMNQAWINLETGDYGEFPSVELRMGYRQYGVGKYQIGKEEYIEVDDPRAVLDSIPYSPHLVLNLVEVSQEGEG